jgi:hypothetical protein
MRALTVCPREPGTVSLGEVSEPAEGDGLLLAGGEDQVDLGGLYRHLVLTNQIIIATMTATAGTSRRPWRCCAAPTATGWPA